MELLDVRELAADLVGAARRHEADEAALRPVTPSNRAHRRVGSRRAVDADDDANGFVRLFESPPGDTHRARRLGGNLL